MSRPVSFGDRMKLCLGRLAGGDERPEHGDILVKTSPTGFDASRTIASH